MTFFADAFQLYNSKLESLIQLILLDYEMGFQIWPLTYFT